MINMIEFRNDHGKSLSISLSSPQRYLVRSVEGLGPAKANLVTSSQALLDGGVFQKAFTDMRNIVVDLGFNPVYGGASAKTIQQLRREAYAFFTPSQKLTILIYSFNAPTMTIVGYVESTEPAIFSQQNGLQISILCPDPHFTDEQTVGVITKVDVNGVIELDYQGDIAAGFDLKFTAGTVGTFRIEHQYPGHNSGMWVNRRLVGAAITDQFWVTTRPGARAFKMRQNNTQAWGSQLGQLGPPTNWPMLLPGINRVRVFRHDGSSSLVQGLVLEYNNRYGGL